MWASPTRTHRWDGAALPDLLHLLHVGWSSGCSVGQSLAWRDASPHQSEQRRGSGRLLRLKSKVIDVPALVKSSDGAAWQPQLEASSRALAALVGGA